jgi:DNA polymerase/3'-5' exonuclease PolX
MADGGPTALLRALDSFRELRAEAPSDITDEWQQVIRSIEALQRALDDADVDPADYENGKPPEGVGKQDREAIAQAADEIGSRETEVALAGVRQEALDVCKTQLWL